MLPLTVGYFNENLEAHKLNRFQELAQDTLRVLETMIPQSLGMCLVRERQDLGGSARVFSCRVAENGVVGRMAGGPALL